MIENINIFQIFPKFILEDRDGYAMCKALEAGINAFLETLKEGIDTLLDVDEMPEWRLDEMAWEYGCMYDYDADEDIKREWIRNAYMNGRIHGTAEGIRQYLSRYFGESYVYEFWEFSGDPGTFNVAVTGSRTDENEAWIRKAVAKGKNVRSELNEIIFNGGEVETITEHIGMAIYGIRRVETVVMY